MSVKSTVATDTSSLEWTIVKGEANMKSLADQSET